MASTIDIRYSHKVDRFYGIGNNTPELGTEEYVLDNVGGIVDFQLPATIVISDRAGIVIEYRNYTIADKKENPYLNSDIPYIGKQGGEVSGMGLVWVWDNRDHLFFPNHGGFTQAKVLFYSKDMGSDFTYSWLEVNARRYWAFSPDHVLATQVYLNTVGGTPPFFKLPALGGSNVMRGYFQGRYRDDNYLAIQLEYRQYFWWRFGYVVFAAAGDVADELTSIQLRYLKPSYGAGIRFLFNKEQKINLRMDIGFGKNTNGIYFGIEEAF
jgi:outer membrane protein assembly factor BamA